MDYVPICGLLLRSTTSPPPKLETKPVRDGRLSGLSTAMVSKQSVYCWYATTIAVVSRSNRHASLGNWSAAAVSIELTSSRAASNDANH